MKWLLKRNKIDVGQMAKDLQISDTLASLLANRNIKSRKEALAFLYPQKEALYDPFLLHDMDKAVDILLEDIKNQNKVVIFGDYDVDGVMSSVILYKGLKKAGANVENYIPHRSMEGYGLNLQAVESLYHNGMQTLLTCDNGIASLEEVALAKKLGVKVVVLDHHEPVFERALEPVFETADNGRRDVLPTADAIVDPKKQCCGYACKTLCAGGLSYKFMQALHSRMPFDWDEEEALTLAAMATICDIVDLLDENRILVSLGLPLIGRTKNLGLQSLLKETGLTDKKITVYHVGFILGPCINASGRLDTAQKAFELFTAGELQQTAALAAELFGLNTERKNKTQSAVNAIKEKIEAQDHLEKVLVFYHEEIHESIAGIVAGRIKETYYHPAIVITKGEDCAKGSARSIEGYNIFEALLKQKELFIKFGGHPMAAGLSLPYENIDLLRARLNENCLLRDEDFVPNLRIEKQLSIDEVSMKLYHEIVKMEPFGKANPAPLFATMNVKVGDIQFIGKQKEILRFSFAKKNGSIKGISFDGYSRLEQLLSAQYGPDFFWQVKEGSFPPFAMDIVYEINLNEYNGYTSLQLLIKDFRLAPFAV